MNPIVQKKIYFNRLIRGFYKLTNGQIYLRVDLKQLGVELKIVSDIFFESYNALNSEGFIEPFGEGYNSRLTDKGVKYIESLEFMEDKEIILLTTKYLKTMTGYRKIYDIFDGIGVREDVVYRKSLLDFMYKQNLIEPSNYSEESATISQQGRNLTEATYDNLLTPKVTHIISYNSKRQIMLEAYKNEKVHLEIELQPMLKDYLNDADIREFMNEFFVAGYITAESKLLSNGGQLMGHHITNKGLAFLDSGGFLKQEDSKKVIEITNNSIINHGPNYGNQSAGSIDGGKLKQTINKDSKEENSKSLVKKFWKLISENPLISGALLLFVSFISRLIYKHYFGA